MPIDHARKNQLNSIKDAYGVKHADAIALLDHPDVDERAMLLDFIETYRGIDTYTDAVAYLEEQRNDPLNQVMCETCGWVWGMVCPECPGCGCYNAVCSGWRHHEYMDEDERAELNACDECGGNPYNPPEYHDGCICD